MKQLDVVMAGEDVLISNCTDDALSYSWDFGDGNTSTLKNPHHFWETAGEYTITLEAENEDGVKTETMDITVEPSVYGFWDGKILLGENELLFTLNITQSAYKIKGEFKPVGSRTNGVLSSNSQISGDSVTLICTLTQFLSMGNDESLTYSNTYHMKGVINQSLDKMEGTEATRTFNTDIEFIGLLPDDLIYDSWEATKRQ